MDRSTPRPIAVALTATAVAFAGLGVALPIAVDAPPFALYRAALAAGIGEVDPRTRTLLLGITGASIAGKWVAHLALLAPLTRGERWAWTASVAGLASWLAIDSVVCLAHGAWWNVAYVNLVPLLTFGVLLAIARTGRGAEVAEPPAVTRGSPAWWAMAVAVAGAVSGLAIAFAGTSPLFGPWRDGLSAAHHGGVEDPRALRLAASFFGPIGGSTFAQFVLLGALARHRASRGDVRALDWSLASFLAWLVPDCAWSLASDGGFNVLLVNVPFGALALPPLLWARARLASKA